MFLSCQAVVNHEKCLCTLLQVTLLVSQSVVLGSLTDYFTIESPTGEDTRNAYLYAAGTHD